MNVPSRGGAFIRRGRLKEGRVYLLFLICRGAFIRGSRFKKREAFIRGFTVINLILDSRNMIKASKTMSL